MVDVVMSADNLTVLGGPAAVEVDFGIGAEGARGSLIFTDFGNPNLLNVQNAFPTPPQSFDLYIDSDPSSDSYLTLFQYSLSDGVLSWQKQLSLQTSAYSINEVVSFSAGQATLNLDITDLGLDSALFESLDDSFAHFHVQATASNQDVSLAPANTSNPIAFSITVDDAFFDGTGLTDPAEFPLKLPITVNAVEFDGTGWSEVSNKDIIMYFSVSYADPATIVANLGGNS